MAASSERSPPPFPDSEEPDVLDAEDVGGRDSDDDDGEEFFASPSNSLIEVETTPPAASQASNISAELTSDVLSEPLMEAFTEPVAIQTESKPTSETLSEPSEDFVDLSNSEAAEVENTAAEVGKGEAVFEEPSEEFEEILGSETEAPQDEAAANDVTVDITASPTEDVAGGNPEQEAKEAPPSPATELSDDSAALATEDVITSSKDEEEEEATTASIIDLTSDSPALITEDLSVSGKVDEEEAPASLMVDLSSDPSALITEDLNVKVPNPLDDLLSEAAPPKAKAVTRPPIDLFDDDDTDLFAESKQTSSARQAPKTLFDDPDEDLFGEPLGAISKKVEPTSRGQKDKPTPAKAASEEVAVASGPLNDAKPEDPADIFTEEALTTTTNMSNVSVANSKTNGIHTEEDTDIFAEATVELSLDSPQSERRKNTSAPLSVPAATTSASAAASPAASTSTASMAKPQPALALEELEEEEELEDKCEITVSVTNPEKIGDGMNAYMAYKVSTQTTLSMFHSNTFTVMRRFSDFLGLFEKLTEKHAPNGYIVPPPPEKSILGMTKVKVGKDDPTAADFVERRRAALERYLQRVVAHPLLLQEPNVREFLEKDELPRAVSTQALSGAGFLKMINKATDAVSKMTIKMNESDVWFEEKLQEVESADQHFRKLHALVESLVGHRKELSLNTASFAKSVAMLGSAEDNTALSRALSQLAEVEDKMEQLHQDQAANDTMNFSEHIADYIRLLGAVRGSFDQRMKAWQRWQDAQGVLQRKRETEAKLLWANKPDKLQQAKEDIAEWETKVTQYERDFDRVSATVRKEVLLFEKEKTRNFRKQIIKYLESMLQSQQQLIKYWEAFLPEAKAIA